MQTSDNTQTPKNFKNLVELSKLFTDETVCRKYLEKLLWNGKPVCPRCGFNRVYAFPDGRRYKCASNTCYKQFTVTVGTFFESTKVPLTKWFHALYIFSSHKKGVSSHQLGRDLSVTQKTAWFILNRLRGVFTEKGSPILSGIFEVDETYVGGKEGNKHRAERSKVKRLVKSALKNGKAPTWADSKTCVFGMAQRDGIVRNWVVAKQQKSTLINIINQNIAKGSTMYSDEYLGYRPLSKIGYKHETVNHSRNEYVRGEVFTANLDSYWSGLKRGLIGIYHQVSRKHLHRYCNEFSFRYNTRKLTEVDRFDLAIQQCVGRLKYGQLIQPVVPAVGMAG